ncbi:MAG: diguanylate cyclase [Oscillospiraceae bacterium]|nr:diguanylate cyclase [Oscillospiraceae bacterium]
MRRKKIAVISAENEAVYQNRVIRGINAQAAALGCEILVFTTFVRTSPIPDYRSGEINIYNLVNYDELDGIIVLYLPFEQDELLDEVIPKIRENAKCPVVCVDNGRASDDFYAAQIFADDSECMEIITDHVIETHGCTDVICVTGPENDRGAEARRDGFIKSMEKHSLSAEGKVFYGAFWFDNGEEVAKKIISCEIPCPQAIVCAGDHIAAGAVNYLEENGFHIPQDIIVTGHDGSEAAVYNKTCITSVVPAIEKLGAKALSELWTIITGEKNENVYGDCRGVVKYGLSCGCKCDIDFVNSFREQDDFVHTHNFRVRPKTDNGILDESYMPEVLTASTSSNDLITRIVNKVYLINDYRFFMMFLCENWEDTADNDNYLSAGYTQKVNMVIHNTSYDYLVEHPDILNDRGWSILDDYSESCIDIKRLCPDLDGRYDEPMAWYFTPLHFNDRCFGYSVLATGLDQPPFDHIYRNWTRNVNNALEMQRIRNIFIFNSMRDSLTGLYNRRGLQQYLDRNTPTEDGCMIFYLVADMNRLKYINDTFGHSDGDNGIMIISSAARACAGYDEICVRTGGDEFAVVGFGNYSEEDIEHHKEVFEQYLEHYNNTSGKPYELSASIGICCRPFKAGDSVTDAAEYADKLMYENKLASKLRRND